MANPTKLTVLISGNGSNLQALIDACASNFIPNTQIVRVISNKKDVMGLKRAEKAGIPTLYHNLVAGGYMKAGEKDQERRTAGRQKYDADLAAKVLEDQPDLVVCAGWMHILAPTFLDPLSSAGVPCINLHPALPGKYDGINAIARAYQDFLDGKLDNDETGVMIHYVISEVDAGQPILVEKVKIQKGETLEDLTERIHGVEHKAIVQGTEMAIDMLDSTNKQELQKQAEGPALTSRDELSTKISELKGNVIKY